MAALYTVHALSLVDDNELMCRACSYPYMSHRDGRSRDGAGREAVLGMLVQQLEPTVT